ncbi:MULTISPECIES: hypothetical protein [unclassified Janthinobacterium]|uniref:hypothetical protein n=1 Tax=unclassified Janthinobacterium TaxID=2610881 RepID=UPI0016144616|nr:MULTISPECIES: hypothetical protein [unclassified Janthinobacterium]MBB5371702.1 hypothetical protein [Janthinobacterium sp. K2C7]MBB5389783.1 hypothetical protein [Janthinobacterium sp. K2E3]
MTKRKIILALCATHFLFNNAGAQNSAVENLIEDTSQVVQIKNYRDPELKSYQKILKAIDEFEKYKNLAPSSSLKFRLIFPRNGKISKPTLRLVDNDKSIDIPVSSDGIFEVKRIDEFNHKEAELIVNTKKGEVRWRPEVRSSNVDVENRRLGDLRVECQIRWVLEKDELSFIQRSFFSVLGGPCESSKINTYYLVTQPISSVVIKEGEETSEVKVWHGGYSYLPPISEKNWSNDAVLIFERNKF